MATVPSLEAFAAALCEVDAALDWQKLGELYCHSGGELLFDEKKREALRETGLLFAADVATALERQGPKPGRSLYVGASVAELAPLLYESLALGRDVVLVRPAGEETDVLASALARVTAALGLPLPGFAEPDGELPEHDHLWLVSVLTDPEAFPALHDVLYERTGDEATNRGDFSTERAAALKLVDRLLSPIAPDACISTTDEELTLLGTAIAGRGWRLEVPERGRLSEVVGDVVRHCRLTQRA